MKDLFHELIKYLHRHGVSIVKEIIIPSFGLDKIAAYIGIYYVVRSFNSSYKVNRVNFLMQLTQNHREIWKKIHDEHLNERIKDEHADPLTLTNEEKRHIVYIINHIKTNYEALKAGVKPFTQGEYLDAGKFLNYPLTNETWNQVKWVQEKKFQRFIEFAKHKANPTVYPKPPTLISLKLIEIKNTLIRIWHRVKTTFQHIYALINLLALAIKNIFLWIFSQLHIFINAIINFFR